MPYHFHLTLQQRAILSVAISIWNNQKAKNKISKWSYNLQKFGFIEARDKWHQLTSAVLKEVNQNLLPPQLRGELIYIINALGQKIYNWYIYIWHEYYDIHEVEGDIINYIGEIYWTPIGTIDEVKILQTCWLKNPKLDIAVIYNIACKNALEKDIDDLWQKMPCDIKNCFDDLNIYRKPKSFTPIMYMIPFDDHLISAYWKYRRDGRTDHFKEYTTSNDLFRAKYGRAAYNQNYSTEHNMFLLSVHKGYSAVAKYFWKKLTQDERDSSLLYSAYVAVNRSRNVWKYSIRIRYRKEKYVEILIFLINQMTIDQKESFLRRESVPEELNCFNITIKNVKEGILDMLLSTWPWQELFIPVLNDMLQYLEHNIQPVYEAVYKISKKMLKLSYGTEFRKYQSLLHETWLIIPASMKRTIIQNGPDSSFYFEFTHNLLKLRNLDSIKMIFNDPEIADLRMQYIEYGQPIYRNLICDNQYERLNQFIAEVLRSEEEKIYFKSIIDDICLCKEFVNARKYDSADKLLDWKFETVEERKKCKDHFKNYEFAMKWICRNILWPCGRSGDKAKEEFFRFLQWMFESEDDIACFKKKCLEDFKLQIKEGVFDYENCIFSGKEVEQYMKQILA